MVDGLYHLHQRKRIHVKHQEYPHPNKWVKLLDRVVLCLATIGPLFELPQLFKIYSEKSAQGVSLLTWAFFVLFAIPWVIYGIVHKEKPIIVAYSLWILIDTAIVIGILMYG
jgi:uncharacterized protein with PQ loop repeat